MNRPDILIFIEHVARELDLACLLAHRLRQRHGLAVAIRSICHGLGQTLREPCPRVAVLPYCYSGRDYGVFDIAPAWPGARYVNLAFEQIFLDIQRPFKAPRDRFAHEAVLHLAWGGESAAFLTHSGVKPDNIAVTGCPVMALYREPYRRYFESRESLATRHGLDPRRRWLLIPEQHGVAMHQSAHLYAKGAITPGQARRFQEFADASFAEAMRWWFAAARAGEAEVIVRPRPSVTAQALSARMRQAQGVFPERLHVIKHGSVREWILASQAVASSYSTTLIEAAVAEKALCLMMPVEFPAFCRAAWFPAAPAARDVEGFLQAVCEGRGQETWRGLKHWAMEALGLDGDPVERIVDVLARAARASVGPGSPLECGIVPDAPRDFFTAPLAAHEADELTEAMVRARVQRWEAVVG